MDLEQVDTTIGYLGAKYKSIALTERAATGAVDAPGMRGYSRDNRSQSTRYW